MGASETIRMSPADDIKHFLVMRNATRRKTTVIESGEDYEVAQHAYAAGEREVWARPDLDLVLLSADSLETIKCTHSSYFGTAYLAPERIVSVLTGRKDPKS
jgi:hypothetical protein